MKAIAIHILKERCKGCGVCVEVCQTEVLSMSEDKNKNGYQYPEVQDSNRGLLCSMCEMFCPDFAIWAAIDLEGAQK
jgi:2-oxoglutarate ferredoxin oxidoreductase subunit delta